MAGYLIEKLKHNCRVTIITKETVVLDQLDSDDWLAEDGKIYDDFAVYLRLVEAFKDENTTIKFDNFHSGFYYQHLKEQL